MNNLIFLDDVNLVKGSRALVRVDYNVPMKGSDVVDDLRIQASIETINHLMSNNIKVVLISHTAKESLLDVAKSLPFDVSFFEYMEDLAELKKSIDERDADISLVENLRLWDGEEKNNEAFAKGLSDLGDFFVFDAFSVSHRKHASVVGVSQYLPTYVGLHMKKELYFLNKVFDVDGKKILFLGGAKLKTKLPFLEHAVEIFDAIFLGGKSAIFFMKERGLETGQSIIEDNIELPEYLINHNKIHLPKEYVVERNGEKIIVDNSNIEKIDTIYDFLLPELDDESGYSLTVWNGTFGWYESGYHEGDDAIEKFVKKSNTLSVVGGGDTAAVLNNKNSFSFISSSGGALLHYLTYKDTEFFKFLNF